MNILRRATSGTAASVLASGEGGGASLVQAVFYPRRRFFDEVVEWTGTLQNLWYYVDPFFSGASIREDSNQDKVLNLVTDNTVVYFFDTSSQTTKANRYANNTTTGRAQGTPTVIPFEQVKAIWEAGGFRHTMSPGSRRIFTMIDNTGLGMPLLLSDTNAFTDTNASSLRSQQLGPDAVVVTLFCDDNKKYLSTDLLSPEPVREGYLSPDVHLLGFRSVRRTCRTCWSADEDMGLA